MSTSTTIIAAIIISFAVSVILCPIVIPMLKKLKFGLLDFLTAYAIREMHNYTVLILDTQR